MVPKDGLVLFGYCLDILLYGILTVQLYIYYLSFPNDRRMTKATAAFVYVVGTLQTAFALRDFYTLFCTENSYLTPTPLGFNESLRNFGFMWITIPLSGASVAAVSQLFYAYRIRILSRKKLIPGLVFALALLQLTAGIIVSFTDYKPGGYRTVIEIDILFVSGIALDTFGWELLGAICDLLITVYMLHFLSRSIQRSFRPTKFSLIRIKRLILETGFLTTGVALAYVVTSATSPSPAFVIPGLALSKIYGNSILALLNSRLRIPGGRNEVDGACVVEHFSMTERHPELPQAGLERSIPV